GACTQLGTGAPGAHVATPGVYVTTCSPGSAGSVGVLQGSVGGSGCRGIIPRHLLSQQKGIPCHLCQMAVSVVGKILQDNRTEEKLRVFLDKKCQYLPFQDWSVKCKKMVDTGILILSDPKVVCGTIKLCQPRESPTGALKFQESSTASTGPAQDFADLITPFIANVPLLLHPQDLPRGEAQVRITEEVCGDCLQLVAALQLELGTNAASAQALVAHAERACEGMAPTLAQQVTVLGTPLSSFLLPDSTRGASLTAACF
uniref:Saposin B-type domain-containing protein n=1 Tax=Calidris pygmaea TaxID=425635 RepID=A0A8C3JSH6_9CHAR